MTGAFAGNSASCWQTAESFPPLAEGEIHVWRVSLQPPAGWLAYYRTVLDSEEQARAARFYFERDRRRFLTAHGAMRMILAEYVKRPARQLAFEYNRQGKPALAPGCNPAGMRFNLSHSGELALLAVTRAAEVGVDLEHIRPEVAVAEIAQRFFSPQEVARFLSVPESERQLTFFNCWTRKEAFIKANGLGLSLPLDQFSVSCAPDEPPQLLHFSPAPQEVWQWSLHALSPGEGYVGALAVKHPRARLACWQWHESPDQL